jgi:four helix bundle protein
MSLYDHRDLLAWQGAMSLVRSVYVSSRRWPADERFGLTSQIRRSAVSIPSNIAEGHGRRSPVEFARFLLIAHGSLMELETQIQIAADLGFCSASELETVQTQAMQVGRMIHGLRMTLKKPSK